MTPRSRPPAEREPPAPPKRPESGLCLRWPAICIPLLTAPGCFYLGPMPYLVETVPPKILRQYPENVVTVDEQRGGQAFVIAGDTDEEEGLTFAWWLSEDGYVGTAQPIENGNGSLVELSWDAALDGQELRCLVYDSDLNSADVSWLVEVL